MTEVLTFSAENMYEKLRTFYLIPTLVEKIIAREVVARACVEANIAVEADELQQAVNDWRSTNKLSSIESTQSWLKEHYLSLEELGESISANILADKLARYLFENKVESYFLDYQLDYMQVSMYEIVLDNEGIAMELFYAMNEEEISFFDAAYRYIRDTELSRKGGYKGTLCRKNLKPEISAAVFATNPPEILKPIVTSTEIHLIRVEEIIKPKLDYVMRQKIISELFDAWLMQQVEQFEVKINYRASEGCS